MGFLWFATICLCIGATFLLPCDARRNYYKNSNSQQAPLQAITRKSKLVIKLDDYTSSDPYSNVGSPMPPFGDVMGSLSPSSSPLVDSTYCADSPPQPPPTTIPTPSFSPPTIRPPDFGPNTPIYEPSPPGPISTNPPVVIIPSPQLSPPTYGYIPSPPEVGFGPPLFEPTPAYGYTPSPPISEPPPAYGYTPSPPEFSPGPPVFQPPVVYPPPSGSPPPTSGVNYGRWCVAKPSVPDPIILEAMNYACGSGADCDSIQSDGKCYEPDTILSHASYAFNSYWQRTKVIGGTCDFGGTAILITEDPSYDGCHFQLAV